MFLSARGSVLEMAFGKARILQTRSGNIVERRSMFTVQPRAKQKSSIYSTPEFRKWREFVIQQAGGRCQHIDENGRRCPRTSPSSRMFADHIVELKDGGAPFDAANGQALCGSHHTLKTVEERTKRMHAVPVDRVNRE